MSEEDSELQRLKAKRLAEMQRNISTKQETLSNAEPAGDNDDSPAENPRDSLLRILGFRGLEVLENAESQFPSESKMIIEKLSELIKNGEINEGIDGGKLLTLFRSVGLNVRMDTRINVEKDGKLVSLSDKLSSQSSENGGDKEQ